MAVEVPLHLPRNAFSPRDAARAGDVWRACQDVAVLGASALGWTPRRFREAGAAFVVRHQVVVHHREARYGEPVSGRTWISGFRRGLLCDRQIRITASGAPLADATQEWAHVSTEGGLLRAARASDAVLADFPVEPPGDAVELPALRAVEGAPTFTWRFPCWYTWMDPLAHANHPAYVDWADEALARLAVGAGLDPVGLRPVAERVRWRAGVSAPEEILVRTRAIGWAGGALVCDHEVETAAGAAATVRTVREMVDGSTAALGAALGV